ncbi:Os04g0498650 [Oryza sativa Japonica Group]|uniref:Os04g0498650 protein n=1 Tax=Oryza sativa subsp. japonica TaxID=39947 RepID=A0A0P0WC67_ORYSJ|nr:hypothetical protein EE612_024210 [Oryza sativa]BAS89912.1 Os04g0498650 [Oryza sativa Japonica Group]
MKTKQRIVTRSPILLIKHSIILLQRILSPGEKIAQFTFLNRSRVHHILSLEAVQNRFGRPNSNRYVFSSVEALVDEEATTGQLLLYHVVAFVSISIELLCPCSSMTMPTKDGNSNRELRRAKAPEDPLHQVAISKSRGVEAHDLITGVAEAILRGHMNGRKR